MNKIIGQDQNKKVLELGIKQDLPVLLVGETGTGKTSIIRELANNQKKNLIRVNLNGQTSIDEFVGHWLVKNGATYWQDGVLVKAMKSGSWIVLDEINACLPEILFVLQSLLDDDRHIILTENNADIIKPAKGFRFFATMNPSDEYAGTKELNKALISRFPLILEFLYPDVDTEIKIVMSATKIKKADAKKWVEFFHHLRDMKANEDIFYTASTRDLIYVCSLIAQGFAYREAFEFAMLHRATNGDKDILRKEYEKFFNEVLEMEKKFNKPIDEILNEIKKALEQQERKKELLNEMAETLEQMEKEAIENIMKQQKEAQKELDKSAKNSKNTKNTKSKEKKENKKKETKSSGGVKTATISAKDFIKGIEKNKIKWETSYSEMTEKEVEKAEQAVEAEKEQPTPDSCSHQCDNCPSKDSCMADVKGVK